MIPDRQFERKVADLGPQGLAQCLGSTDAGLPALAPTARCPLRVKNRHDALEMGCVGITPESGRRSATPGNDVLTARL